MGKLVTGISPRISLFFLEGNSEARREEDRERKRETRRMGKSPKTQ